MSKRSGRSGGQVRAGGGQGTKGQGSKGRQTAGASGKAPTAAQRATVGGIHLPGGNLPSKVPNGISGLRRGNVVPGS